MSKPMSQRYVFDLRKEAYIVDRLRDRSRRARPHVTLAGRSVRPAGDCGSFSTVGRASSGSTHAVPQTD